MAYTIFPDVHHLWFESYMIKNISPIHPPSCWWNTLVSRHRQHPNTSLRSSNEFVRSRFLGMNQFFDIFIAQTEASEEKNEGRENITHGITSGGGKMVELVAHPGIVWPMVTLKVCSESDI